MAGRPSKQTAALEDLICERIALGGQGSSLKKICDQDPELPDRVTVLRWLARSGEAAKRFRHKYTRARELQADAHLDELVDLADELVPEGRKKRKDPEAVAVARLRIDARKFALVKLSPRQYGTRVQVAGDAEEPVLPPTRRQVLDFASPDMEAAFLRLVHRSFQTGDAEEGGDGS